MPFKIIRNDITKVKVDALVNPAKSLPRIGTGTDYAIYLVCGQEKLFILFIQSEFFIKTEKTAKG